MTRPYCRCDVVQNYSLEEAAAKLRCEKRFLQDNISRLARQKLGKSVAFCDCELRLIQALCSIFPASAGTEPERTREDTTAVPALTSIRPSPGRRTRRVS